MQSAVETLRDPRQLRALADPHRLEILDALRSPDSAAGVARALGRSRQSVNYHVKALLKAGLLEKAGSRRSGNFVEQLYRAAARRFIVSPEIAMSRERLAAAFAEQAALGYLADFGARVSTAAHLLAERTTDGSTGVPSATVESHVRFADEAVRSAFLSDYVAMLEDLLEKHAATDGEPYRVALVVYPNPGEST